MDRVYRELFQFPLKDIQMIAESAYHVRECLDSNTSDSDTNSRNQ